MKKRAYLGNVYLWEEDFRDGGKFGFSFYVDEMSPLEISGTMTLDTYDNGYGCGPVSAQAVLMDAEGSYELEVQNIPPFKFCGEVPEGDAFCDALESAFYGAGLGYMHEKAEEIEREYWDVEGSREAMKKRSNRKAIAMKKRASGNMLDADEFFRTAYDEGAFVDMSFDQMRVIIESGKSAELLAKICLGVYIGYTWLDECLDELGIPVVD